MPGSWNIAHGTTWANPPTILAFASSTQVAGGRIVRISGVIPRYQTIFRVAATGGDVVGGTYEWLFTSGSTTGPNPNPWANTWRATPVVMNNLQNYGFGGSGNNTITLQNGWWYTMNWEDRGYQATRAIFMATSGEPVHITTVSSHGNQLPNQSVNIGITTDRVPSPEERLYVRYTSNNWVTSALAPVTISGTSGSATIPGHPAGTLVSYYVFSTTVANITADHDLFTIRMNNNNGSNYSYNVVEIGWANLQYPPSPTILAGDSVWVFAQVYSARITDSPGRGAGINAWIGYNSSNTDPSTWTTWVPAIHNPTPLNDNSGSNDEYFTYIGSSIATPGTYYFASRFQLDAQSFVYGGYSPTGGGIWNGTSFVSGTLTVNSRPLPIQILYFNAEAEGSKVKLCWATATETNNHFFTVYRSHNARDWNIVAIRDGAGNSNEMMYYQLYDFEPYAGISYYRLKQTDYDGAYEYFRSVGVNFIFAPEKVKVFPNPATDRINIVTDKTDYTIVISDIYGKTIKTAFNTGVIYTDLMPQEAYVLRIIFDCGNEVRNILIVCK